MKQVIGVFLAVILTAVVLFAYMFVFSDEFNERAPVNQNGGFTPLRRHFVEMVLIQISTFLTATALFYWFAESPQGPKLDWPKVRFVLLGTHVISGAVILVGVILAIKQGQAIQVRDGVTVVAGTFFLGLSFVDYYLGSGEPSSDYGKIPDETASGADDDWLPRGP